MSALDVELSDGLRVQLGVYPKLGLIIISDLRDFAENWFEVTLTETYEIRILAGHENQGSGNDRWCKLIGACRYLIDCVIDKTKDKVHFQPETMSHSKKFIININLRDEILDNKQYLGKVKDGLLSLFEEPASEKTVLFSRRAGQVGSIVSITHLVTGMAQLPDIVRSPRLD